MDILPLSAFKDNYIWVIRENSQFDCVDPGEAGPVLTYAKEHSLILRSILITHHHYDHMGGVGELIRHFPKAVVYGPNDSRIPQITEILSAKQKIHCGKNTFEVLETPGHTSTHISYFEPEKKWLFCGDTLFSAGCGRVFDGTMQDLYHSLLLYKHLPEDTLVFCAHEYTVANLQFALLVEPSNTEALKYLKTLQHNSACSLPSTIALEKKINPFFRTDQATLQHYVRQHGVDSDKELAVFRFLRNEKDNF